MDDSLLKLPKTMIDWRIVAVYTIPQYEKWSRWRLLQSKNYPTKGLLIWNSDVGTRIKVCVEGMVPAYDEWRNRGFSAVCVCKSCRRFDEGGVKLHKIMATAKRYGIEVVFTRHELVIDEELFFREMRINEAQQLGLDLEKWQNCIWCIR